MSPPTADSLRSGYWLQHRQCVAPFGLPVGLIDAEIHQQPVAIVSVEADLVWNQTLRSLDGKVLRCDRHVSLAVATRLLWLRGADHVWSPGDFRVGARAARGSPDGLLYREPYDVRFSRSWRRPSYPPGV